MADATTKLTPAQKIETTRKTIEEINRGEVNPERLTPDAAFHATLLGEVSGRDAIVAALKRQRASFEEFRLEPHAILADEGHTVALINLTARGGGREVRGHQVMVLHTNDKGQIRELWSTLDAESEKKTSR